MTGAREYHERTKHSPRSVREDDFSLDWENQPRPYKRYRDLPTRELAGLRAPMVPALAAIADPGRLRPDDEAAATVDREALTALCYCTAGITQAVEQRGERLRFRAASCTGALYHVDVYLVAGDSSGLSAGVYHFDPSTFSLDVLREGDYRKVLAEASAHSRVRNAPVTVVTTSRWWGNAWKYRDRTFRHAWWDSGTMVANLLATASAVDLPAEVVLGFADDPVADLLGVDPHEEAPLELVAIGGGDPAPDPPEPSGLDPETEPLSPDPEEYPLIHEAWAAGTLPDGEAAREWRAVGDDPVGTREAGDGERYELDPVRAERASKRPLYETVRRRTSCREFANDPVSYRKLSTVLDRALRGVPVDARGDDAPPLQFNDLYLLVNAVEDLPQGTYHCHPEAGELERIGEASRETATHLALDQGWAGDAAVCAYFLTDLAAVVDALGDRGYRLAQFEAAATAGRLYLGTYAHRTLGGIGLTFYDDVVTDHLEPRAEGQTPTFLYAFGERSDL